MPTYSSSDSDSDSPAPVKLFGAWKKPAVRSVLGRGKVADVLLWKDKWVSVGLTVGMSLIWFLFEVAEYNLVTLLCHISITSMLILFIWCNGAEFFNWSLPRIPSLLHENTIEEISRIVHSKIIQAMSFLFDIACGKDPTAFILVILGLFILSLVGNYFTFLNFVYFGYICLQTLPFLYDRYETEVDYYAGQLFRKMMKSYKRFDSRVLNKIPRAPGKEKKTS